MSQKRVQRRQSRVLALKTLFFYLERNETQPLKECFDYILVDIDDEKADEFAWEIVNTAVTNLGKIKVLIRAFAPEYQFNKIATINRSLLILGIGEMKFMETPPVVVINEYIELAKEFGEDKSPSFINGVLDNYRKGLGLDRTKAAE
ncbi:transcription antitermination factor NusB [bacterium]|nr:transcription antitermination factor NusB [bacterium]NCQ55498.1 transcription antitermination factor NusB [Candidatus Parcubacteria bacterium]NCS67509.1 transcription antitermination factor NusB [Candidatus Peregrinibacteria bacterium]NCS96326.1 transcription antitermination factor NusB [bacterium]